MVDVGYRSDDAKEIRKALRTLGDDLADFKQINQDAVSPVEDQARTEVPVDDSDLYNTIRSSGTKTKGIVRAGNASVPYAGAAHFGHDPRPQGGYMLADPYLYDAYTFREDEVIDIYEDGLDRKRKEAGLK